MKADTIEFKIVEGDKSVQVLEINIEPGRTVIADAGSLIYVDEEIDIEVKDEAVTIPEPFLEPDIFPEPEEEEEPYYEEEQDLDKPLLFKLVGALRKTMTPSQKEEEEEELPPISHEFEEPEKEEKPYFQVTHFFNNSDYIRSLAFASSRFGKIFDINLKETFAQELIIQKGAFICAAKGTQLSHFLDTEVKMNPDDREGFIFEKIEGKGLTFLNASGKIIPKKLNESAFRVNLANIVAFESSLDLQVHRLKRLPTLYGESDNCLVILSGTGKVWLQSSTPQHLAQNLIPYLPQQASMSEEMPEEEEAFYQEEEEEVFGGFDMNAPIEDFDPSEFNIEEEPKEEEEIEEREIDSIPEDPSPEELAQFMKDMGIDE